MPATLYNAPARPLLTGLVLLVLVMALLAILSMAFAFGPSTRPNPSTSGRPAFTRRISTLPAIVATPPEADRESEIYKTDAR